jgi:adenine/guanine phosphoribosyltransferase-like PRPP-binding protein
MAAGGLAVPSRDDPAAREIPVERSRYDPIDDPAGAERLGVLLAERARGARPSVVLVWEEPHQQPLAHVVARELGVRAVRTWNADGLVGHAGSMPPAARVLIVGDAFYSDTPLQAMRAFVDQQGGTVVGVAVLLGTGAAAEAGAELFALLPEPSETALGET